MSLRRIATVVIILGLFALLQVAIIFSIPRERHSEDFDNALGCPACPAPHAERAEEQNSNDSPNKSERRRVVEGSVVEALGETTPFVSAFELAARDSDASGAELKGDAARPRLFVADFVRVFGLFNFWNSDVDYLSRALDSIQRQMPADPLDPLYGRLLIFVMNNNGHAAHSAFETARARFGSATSPFVFLENAAALNDADPSARDTGHANFPGWKVRKQTRDIVSLARFAQGKSHYYMFMEDDFELCGRALTLLHYAIGKARTVDPNWLSIKVSYGMNGFVLRNNNDLELFSNYLLEHQARRPPVSAFGLSALEILLKDHLITEWAAGETAQSAAHKAGRPHFAFRFNLLEHIGESSSLRPEKQGNFARCYEELNNFILFEIDAFKFTECGHDDISPCNPESSAQHFANPPLSPCLRIGCKDTKPIAA